MKSVLVASRRQGSANNARDSIRWAHDSQLLAAGAAAITNWLCSPLRADIGKLGRHLLTLIDYVKFLQVARVWVQKDTNRRSTSGEFVAEPA